MKTSELKNKLSRLLKINNKALIAVVILVLIGSAAIAQNKWSFELRPGVNIATAKLGDADLKTGFGFEGAFAYKVMPHLAAYAGWSWNKFAADKSFAGSNVDFEETGYCFGLQFIHPIEKSKISYMIKGGGTYNHIETENSEGKIINDTGHGFGWQAGAGVAVSLGKSFQLIPEVRYRSLSRDIKLGDGNRSVDLNYISAGVGLTFSF
jgi:Outer membrane protein beta-barrel domain